MSPAAARLVAQAVAQGFPERTTDPDILRRIAATVGVHRPDLRRAS